MKVPLSSLVDELRFEVAGLKNSKQTTATVLRTALLRSWIDQLEALEAPPPQQLRVALRLLESAAPQFVPIQTARLAETAIANVKAVIAAVDAELAEAKLDATLARANSPRGCSCDSPSNVHDVACPLHAEDQAALDLALAKANRGDR